MPRELAAKGVPMKHRRREPMRVTGRIGFYGCDGGGGRLVRCALVGDSNRPPRSAMVECPNCANRHLVELTWRQLREADEGREAELLIEAIE
ncbi:MAG TPA: hypothetical protein VND98_06215 [Solirubrobacterales bacterium]|nr:hypothetical protein [Solirubrobacterales bacterium]